MKKVLIAASALGFLVVMPTQPTWALSPETTMLLDLLKAKGVITQNEATEFTKALEDKTAAAAPAEDDHHHSVQSLADRVERLEGKSSEGAGEVLSKVNLSGLVEVNMSSNRRTGVVSEPDEKTNTTNSSDVTLNTAQLNADATINPYVNARLALLYEEDPDDSGNNNITLDEAIIGLKGGEAYPVYANLGRMYVPFGHFESHFISDPLTLTLGETNDTAVVAGYANDIIDLNAGVLRGKVKETGKSSHINTAVASATLSLPKDKDSKEGLNMSGGVSYLSNLATSDELAESTTIDGEVADTAGGVSAFLSMSYSERFFFDAEYLGALDDFAEDDFVDFTDAHNRKPQTWNIEAAARMIEKLEFALRYGGSDEGGEHFLAEDEYGGAVLYEIFDATSLTVEYLFQEFQDDSNNSQATMQVAVEF